MELMNFDFKNNMVAVDTISKYKECIPENAESRLEELSFLAIQALNSEDRNMFLLWVEHKSGRKVAKILGVNYNAIHRAIKDIREQIYAEIERLRNIESEW